LKTAGQGLISAANAFLCAQFLNHHKGLSLTFFIGVEVQEVIFPKKKV